MFYKTVFVQTTELLFLDYGFTTTVLKKITTFTYDKQKLLAVEDFKYFIFSECNRKAIIHNISFDI